MTIARSLRGIALAAALSVACGAAAAQPFPSKPIRVLIPYGAGGASDIAARVLSERLTETLKRPVVVENKPGGNGIVAMTELVRAKADGHTIMIGNLTTSLLQPIMGEPKTPFDPFKDVVPIVRLPDIPALFIATKVNFPPNTIKELVDYARAKPGEVFYSVAGILALSHLDFLRLEKMAGIEITAVPSRSGAGSSQTDLINGSIHVSLTTAATMLPNVQAGKVKAIAVTSPERLPSLPDVPTFKESGFGDIGINAWHLVSAPAGTPPEVIETLSEAFIEALGTERVKAKLLDLQFTPVTPGTPAETQAWMDKERAYWTPVLAEAKELFAAAEKRERK